MRTLLIAVSGLAFGATLAACEGHDLDYAEIGVRTVSSSGAERDSQCTPLPNLAGGTIDEEIPVDTGLSVHVSNTYDAASITIPRTDDPDAAHVTLPRQTLVDGYQRDIPVTGPDALRYTVTLFSPCSAHATEE